MNYNELLALHSRLPRRELSEMENQTRRNPRRFDNPRMSQPRTKVSHVKINKNKLPSDFFPKKETSHKQISHQKIYWPQEFTEPVLVKKAESERLHYSPEKTSFFGFLELKATDVTNKVGAGNKLISRKFETRNEPKRDAFAVDISRKLTTANKPMKSQLLQLFPATYDNQMSDIIITASKSHNLRISPIKQPFKQRDAIFFQNPEKSSQLPGRQIQENKKIKKGRENITKIKEQTPAHQILTTDMMNITFYNAKSSCFPPINRHL